MPSHISHALLVEESIDNTGGFSGKALRRNISADPVLRKIAVLGAQGPDIFLHNHRRKPRGFRYGAILHRKGNADVLVDLALQSRGEMPPPERDEVAAFALGYLSHVWMDRLCHPYINYHAGWRNAPDRHSDRPWMHAFLERIIDVQLLRHLRNLSVGEYGFVRRIASVREELLPLRRHIVRAIRSALWSSRDDGMLERRLANALYDSLGYYRFSESPGMDYFVEGRSLERRGEINPRWLALVHPPEELLMVDALNLERRPWSHPCDPSRSSNETFPALFHRALRRTVDTFDTWAMVMEGSVPPEQLRFKIGDQNLNDGITGDPPCRRVHCQPLPLITLYQQIKTAFD